VAIIYYFVVKAPHRSYPMQQQLKPQP
jgi:hypothetical protein